MQEKFLFLFMFSRYFMPRNAVKFACQSIVFCRRLIDRWQLSENDSISNWLDCLNIGQDVAASLSPFVVNK